MGQNRWGSQGNTEEKGKVKKSAGRIAQNNALTHQCVSVFYEFKYHDHLYFHIKTKRDESTVNFLKHIFFPYFVSSWQAKEKRGWTLNSAGYLLGPRKSHTHTL